MIGIISDTHGLLRPAALDALEGSEQILHAGDVGKAEILEQLRAIAPVTAVRGNVDTSPWARQLPEWEVLETGGIRIYMRHILDKLDRDPAAADMQAVVYGHTHDPKIEERNGVLYLNPGSAGPRRFTLPVSVARLHIKNGRPKAELITLDD